MHVISLITFFFNCNAVTLNELNHVVLNIAILVTLTYESYTFTTSQEESIRLISQ